MLEPSKVTIARSILTHLAIAALTLAPSACKRGEEDVKKQAEAKATDPQRAKPAPSVAAQDLAKRLLIVDGHIDLPYRLHAKRDEQGKPIEDISKHTEKGQFDYPRAVQGGLDAPFLAIYLPAKLQKTPGESRVLADQLIDMVEAIVAAHPDKLALTRSADEVEASFRDGKMAVTLGMENGSALETEVANVEHFYDRGIRYITLTHSKCNEIGDSSYDEERRHHGLSDFGEQVIGEMNRLGMMVDVSHVSDETLDAVLKVSTAPVIASHSGLRHFTPGFERNVSDESVRRVAATGGIVMINFGSMFIDGAAQKRSSERWKAGDEYAKEKGLSWEDPAGEKQIDAYLDERFPQIRARVEQVADHIDRVVELVGIDHVGLGSDYDGVGNVPVGLEDVSKYPNLLRVLLDRGYSEPDLEKLCGTNLLRVWRAVETHAQNLQRAGRP